MKREGLMLGLLMAAVMTVGAQNVLNDKGDNILGQYLVEQGSDVSKVRFTKASDGSYTCQIYWLRDLYDKDGKVYTDERNPDKSLRNVPANKIVLIKGLKYNASKKQWDGTKVYDPQRGLKANVVVTFTDDGQLKVKGSVLGISETVYWKRLNE